jgi:hypothetical protein
MKRPFFRVIATTALLSAAILDAQTVGMFSGAGNMTTARSNHTATLLADGRVLIAGGYPGTDGRLTATAELYDPSTGAFTATANMNRPRADHTATLLPDGTVLITGGGSFTPPVDEGTVERYDPVTGTFTLLAGMLFARHGHSATLLTNGRVLIAGGADPKGLEVSNAEIYDPVTGVSMLASGYVDQYYDLTSTLLPDGKVLITGNNTGRFFDPATNTIGQVSQMIHGQATPTSTLLQTGKVLIVGDSDPGDFFAVSNAAELFNTTKQAFEPANFTIIPRSGHTATLLPDGTVLIAGGGCGYECSSAAATELYDPAGGSFSLTTDLSTPRISHTATLLADGRVLVAGGWRPGSPWVPQATAELFTPAKRVPPSTLLSMSGDGKGQGAIQRVPGYQLVTSDAAAATGDALMIYCTGLTDGNVIPPQVAIGGHLATVISFGTVPQYPGLNYIDVFVPGGIAAGGAVPVQILNYMGRPSNTVTIGVR